MCLGRVGELAMAEKMEQLQHQREIHHNLDKMQDQQRMMACPAWVFEALFKALTTFLTLPLFRVLNMSITFSLHG